MPDRRLPDPVRALFWDVDPDRVDLAVHRDYVMERVMSRGDWSAMCWLRRAYAQAELADFLRRNGRRLSPRDEAYWGLIAGVTVESRPGGGRPAWAG